MYALVELAGKEKIFYIDYFLYYYERTANNGRTYCGWSPMKYDEYKAKIQIPFLPLKDLSEDAKTQ